MTPAKVTHDVGAVGLGGFDTDFQTTTHQNPYFLLHITSINDLFKGVAVQHKTGYG
ncbi:hypothetical protein [Halomonas sp.]|uniref:hypothetical protein n=1 Tax=Halomonas sp. TaxID=1486246 RepID=UPI0035656E33